MIFSYNWINEYLKTDLLDVKKLVNELTNHSFEVDEYKKIKNDWAIDIDVLPNRSHDCFSHIGIARECGALFDKKLVVPGINYKKKQKKLNLEIKIRTGTQRYYMVIIDNVEVKDSPKWIQDRLITCGLKPINNIVDITNYVMLGTGQPIHAFDLDEIQGDVIVRKAKKGETFKSLDNKKYNLSENDLVVADNKKILALAGIKGGMESGVDKKTKTIGIELANFDSKIIRQTSKRLKLRTDASWRFENKIDPNLIDFASDRVADLIIKESNGIALTKKLDFYPQKIKPKKVNLNINKLNNIIGEKIELKKIKKILLSLDFKIKEKNNNEVEVEIPTRRLDISIEEDLIEEIGRIRGYNKIKPILPISSIYPSKINKKYFWIKKIKDILKELQFNEIYTYSFIAQKDLEVINQEVVELENPMSNLNRYLRPNILINLLKITTNNIKYFDSFNIFEIGKVFNKKKKEHNSLTLLKYNKGNFFNLKGDIETILDKINIKKYQFNQIKENSNLWDKNQVSSINIKDKDIGTMGKINPAILDKFNLNKNVFALEIDLDKITKESSEENFYEPISNHPTAIRDLSAIVPKETKAVDILNVINRVGGKLVKDIDIFDIYENLKDNKKSLSFHIKFQSQEKTLSTEEVNKLINKIIKALEKEGWKIRK